MKKKNVTYIIRFVHKIDAVILPLFIFSAFIETILPFINIGMPALILNALSEKADSGEIFFLVGLTVCLNVIILLILAVLNQWKEKRQFYFDQKYRWKKTEKIMTMDYPYLEKSEFINLKQNIHHNDEDFGTMNRIPNQIASLFRGVLTIIISLIAFLNLFQQSSLTSSQSEYEFLNYPWLLVLLIIFFLFSTKLTRMMQKKAEESIPKLTNEIVQSNRLAMTLAGSVVHNYTLGKDIRIYKIHNLVIKEMENMTQRLSDYYKKISPISSLPGAIGGAFSAIMSGLVFIVVSIYALAGLISLGSVVWFAGIVQQFINSVSNLIFMFGDFSIACVRLQAVVELFSLPSIKNQGIEEVPDKEPYEIEFDHVSFQYPGSDVWVLKDFSLKIEGGKRIAVVGMNGSGKTTMIKLLCRLYDPTEGRILLNGMDISKIKEKDYLSLFSIVFQDFNLFSFSLGQNLSVSTEYNAKEATLALEKIGFANRLNRMKHGLKTPLYRDFDEEGVEISGGEAQKIAIARAIYRNAPFVILDEPTAALDPVSEQEIYENFDTLVENKTAVYISHRLSSCRFCDVILVLHEGRLVQSGTHEELVQKADGKYYELWNAQAQYYVNL